MIFDKHLTFLESCTNEELEPLFTILVYDPKDNKKRYTETLSNSDEYKKYGKQYHSYWKRIAEELQLFGGNTLMNLIKGGNGVLYGEIVTDVCKSLKLPLPERESGYSAPYVEACERLLLSEIFQHIIASMSEREINEIAKELDISGSIINKQIVTAFVIGGLRMGGFKSYILVIRLANALSRFLIDRGLPLIANAMLARILSIAIGPIGWIATGTWTAIDLASPALRVTLPACVVIAALRMQQKYHSLTS